MKQFGVSNLIADRTWSFNFLRLRISMCDPSLFSLRNIGEMYSPGSCCDFFGLFFWLEVVSGAAWGPWIINVSCRGRHCGVCLYGFLASLMMLLTLFVARMFVNWPCKSSPKRRDVTRTCEAHRVVYSLLRYGLSVSRLRCDISHDACPSKARDCV